MALSSVTSASYSSTLIQQTNALFSASFERQDTARSERVSENRSERRHEEQGRDARTQGSRRGDEAERRNPFGDIANLRQAFEALRSESHDDESSETSENDGDDDDRTTQTLQSFSATSISINIDFSSIVQLQQVDGGSGQPALPAPAANTADPANAVETAPANNPAEILSAALPSDPAALPATIQDTLQALTALLENQSSSLPAGSVTSLYQSLSFEAQYTSFSLEVNGDQSYQVDLTSISIAFSQSSYSFTDGASSFEGTEFSLDIQAYSASFSSEAYSNSLVSSFLNDQQALSA